MRSHISIVIRRVTKLIIVLSQKTSKCILYIYYLVWFYNIEILVLFDKNSKVNTMIFDYAQKLDFKV